MNYFLSICFSFLLILSSCSNTAKFPVSEVVPAAEISAGKKTDKHGNSRISITARYLASPDRLKKSKKVYVVWVETADNGVKNLGQLSNKNGKQATLVTVTPFKVKEIFITAEDDVNISEPNGTEITRSSF